MIRRRALVWSLLRPPIRLTALLLLLYSGAPSAACLLTDYSTRAEYDRSEAVLVGSVLSERQVPADDKEQTLGGMIYMVKIAETLRGRLGKTVEVFSENSSGRFPMKIGTSYLLFLYRQQGALSADYCGNSGPVAMKVNVLSEVRNLAKP
jgi:hypothetical protein